MGTKRKAEAAALPDRIELQPASGDAPFAVYFPSGFNPATAGRECAWESHAHATRQSQYALLAKTTHNVDFLGTSASAEHTGALPCRLALGVLDKRTGVLHVAPVASGRVIRMEPRARSLSYAAASAGGPAGDADAAAAAALRRERNAALVEQFGSQRRRKQLAAAKSAQVEAGQVSGGGAVLGMIASAGAGAATKDALIAASLAQRNLPPHHLDALTAEEAYRQDEIVPGAVAGALETANLFLAQERPEYRAELAAEGTFGGGYVLSRLAALAAPEAGVRQARARCLAFLGHLLKLLRQRGSGLRVKEGEGLAELAARLKMAPGVLDGVLDAFYVAEPGDEEGGGGGGGRRWSLPKERRELMLAWALVLAVRAEAQSTLEADAFRALVAELCMRPADVVARLREAGCTCLAMSAAGLAGGGARGSAFRVCLMPPTPEPTPFGARFPRLKMGARKPGAR